MNGMNDHIVQWPLVHITHVEVLEDFVVRLTFEDGVSGELDLEPIIWGPVFERHRKDPGFFRQVYVDPTLGTISWPNDTDLDPAVLYARVAGINQDEIRALDEEARVLRERAERA